MNDLEFDTMVYAQFGQMNFLLNAVLRLHELQYGRRVLGIVTSIRQTPRVNLFVMHENFSTLYSHLCLYSDLCIRTRKSGAYESKRLEQLNRVSDMLETMESDVPLMEFLEFIAKNVLPDESDSDPAQDTQ